MLDFDSLLKQEPIVLAIGGATALVAVVLIFVIFRPRKAKMSREGPTRMERADAIFDSSSATKVSQPKISQPKDVERVTSAAESIISDFARGGQDWTKPNGKPAVGGVENGAYHLGAGEGVVSIRSLAVTSGSSYSVNFRVSAIRDATNGEPCDFAVGPVFFDENGKVVRWWKDQPEIKVAEGVRSGVVTRVSPEGATRVCIGIRGNQAKGGVGGNGVVAFSWLELKQA